MAWREQLKTRARFRGVEFSTVDADLGVGRRTQLHEYPLRNGPYTQDMGRRARQFSIEGFVVGDDYLDRRDALIEALEAPGPGELEHPRYGVIQVAVQDYARIKESPREGGIARFSITFVEHGDNQFPTTREDTVSQVDTAAEQLTDAAELDFAEMFDVAGPEVLALSALEGLQADLAGLVDMASQFALPTSLGELLADVTGISSDLVSLIRTPTRLAQSFISLFSSFVLAVKRPVSALAELQAVFLRNGRAPGASFAGSTRARRSINTVARVDLQRRIALASQARVIAVALGGQVTAQQARVLRDRMFVQLDTELEAYDPPAAVSRAIGRLRTAVARDVEARAELLRQSSAITPAAVLPTLVLAHQVYQDATRADELAARNAVRHPAFVPVRPLEILL